MELNLDLLKLADELKSFFEDERYYTKECDCCGNVEDIEIPECDDVNILLYLLEMQQPDFNAIYNRYGYIESHYKCYNDELLVVYYCQDIIYDFIDWYKQEKKRRKMIKCLPKLF